MKKLILILLCLFLASSTAFAGDDALTPALAKHPGWQVLVSDQWGHAAAAVLGKGEERILCVTELQQGAWVLTVDNPRALRQGETPSLLMDTDDALHWSYSDGNSHEAFSSFKGDTWEMPTRIVSYVNGDISYERELQYEAGKLRQITYTIDAEGNLLNRKETASIPAAWVEAYASLNNYDDHVLRQYPDWDTGWISKESLLRSGKEVTNWHILDGSATDDGLVLWTKDDQGELRLVTCTATEGLNTNISSPLPASAVFGYENFGDWPFLPEKQVMFSVSSFADGVWHIGTIWPVKTGEAFVLGRGWIRSMDTIDKMYVGRHPWETLNIDWSTLPISLEEALKDLDPSGWAMVNNPNPADRLHLRDRADKSSQSLGKFYNGTPVEVLEKGKTWSRVRLPGGITGWMMSKYLAFGKDAWQVEPAFPKQFFQDGSYCFPVWSSFPSSSMNNWGDWQVQEDESFILLGVVENQLYYVWFPALDEGGYMLQSDFWQGNG